MTERKNKMEFIGRVRIPKSERIENSKPPMKSVLARYRDAEERIVTKHENLIFGFALGFAAGWLFGLVWLLSVLLK